MATDFLGPNRAPKSATMWMALDQDLPSADSTGEPTTTRGAPALDER
jgi:hypothetical protein